MPPGEFRAVRDLIAQKLKALLAYKRSRPIAGSDGAAFCFSAGNSASMVTAPPSRASPHSPPRMRARQTVRKVAVLFEI
jgi:hypothetical protein